MAGSQITALAAAATLGMAAAIGVAACGEDRGNVEVQGAGTGTTGADTSGTATTPRSRTGTTPGSRTGTTGAATDTVPTAVERTTTSP